MKKQSSSSFTYTEDYLRNAVINAVGNGGYLNKYSSYIIESIVDSVVKKLMEVDLSKYDIKSLESIILKVLHNAECRWDAMNAAKIFIGNKRGQNNLFKAQKLSKNISKDKNKLKTIISIGVAEVASYVSLGAQAATMAGAVYLSAKLIEDAFNSVYYQEGNMYDIWKSVTDYFAGE